MRLTAARGIVVFLGAFGGACAHGGKVASTPRATPSPAAEREEPASGRTAQAEPHPQAIQRHELEALADGDGSREKPPEPAAIDDVRELPVAVLPTSEASRLIAEEAVREEASDFPVELNDAVLSCIDLYQGPLRDWFSEALARGGRYIDSIRETFAFEGIPRDLAYVAMVESAFKTGALSRAKAKGVWQFMPKTGKEFGLAQDWWVDERSNPEKSTRAAARYLKQLYGMFGDWNLALASYNAGPGRLQRAINRTRKEDFWELSRTRALKPETKNYVPLIHAAIVVAKSPGRYGFDVTPEPPPMFERVPVDGAVDLRLIAECVGSPVHEIQSLNSELRRLATPADRTFHLKVPPEAGVRLLDCLEKTPPDKRVRFRTHRVARGETFATVARRYGVRSKDIAEANGIRLGKRLSVGTELIIPIGPTAVPPPRAAAVQTASRSAERGNGAARIRYQVKRGDTLFTIASEHGTTIRDLQSWNRLRGTRIAAGSTLTIYTNTARATEN
jgi:membrane-bound lytic murein transglycosylase D